MARRDHGINSIDELKGKTIATQQGSAVHFFLNTFLLFNNIDIPILNQTTTKAS